MQLESHNNGYDKLEHWPPMTYRDRLTVNSEANKDFVGFIETENEGDIFVHYSGIEDTGGFRSLQEGEKVDFEIEQTQRGPQAVKVKKKEG